MVDDDIHQRIDALVEEEHALRGKPQRDAGDAARLADLEVQLDRCWDLLRRRDALRSSGANPDVAKTPDAEQVENYLQ